MKIYKFILSRQHKDGGWSYYKDKTRKSLYGAKIPKVKIWVIYYGTTLMCMSLWMIEMIVI